MAAIRAFMSPPRSLASLIVVSNYIPDADGNQRARRTEGQLAVSNFGARLDSSVGDAIARRYAVLRDSWTAKWWRERSSVKSGRSYGGRDSRSSPRRLRGGERPSRFTSSTFNRSTAMLRKESAARRSRSGPFLTGYSYGIARKNIPKFSANAGF